MNPSDKQSDKQPKLSEPIKKKRYCRPQLEVYGDMRKVTQHAGENPSAHQDSGMGNPHHIHTH